MRADALSAQAVLLLVVLAYLAAPAPVQAGPVAGGNQTAAPAVQETSNEIVELPRPSRGSTGAGQISPRGTRYAYEVRAPGGPADIWSLDLETGAVRQLTAGPGHDHSLAWAPGGNRIAFWRSGDGEPSDLDGIWVLDLEGGSERRVFGPAEELAFAHSPRWVGSDSILFEFRKYGLQASDETWIVAADGTGARRVQGSGRLDGWRGEGGRRAWFEPCCNVSQEGLWVSRGSEGTGRCLVGPVGEGSDAVWTEDGERILFTVRSGRRSGVRLLSVELATAEVRPVVTPERRGLASAGVESLSASGTGVVAVRLEAAPDSTVLWIVRDPASLTLSSPEVAGCRGRYPEIALFAREQGLVGKLAIESRYVVLDRGFEVFRVSSDSAGPGIQYREAVRAAGRFGWIGPPCSTGIFGDRGCLAEMPEEGRYRPPAGAAWLWSTRFLERLRENRWDRRWVEVLLRAPGLPSSALDSLVNHRRFDELLVDVVAIRSDDHRLVRIWERHDPYSDVAQAALEALWPRAPDVAADPDAPRELLVRLAGQALDRASEGRTPAAVARRLLERPDAGRDPEILARLARLPPSADSLAFRVAGRRLLDHSNVSVRAVRKAAPNIAADPALAERLFADERVVEDSRALRELARTPWRDWSVAERARRELEKLRERRLEEARRRRGIEGRIHVPRAVVRSGPGPADMLAGRGGKPRLVVALLLPRIDPVNAWSRSDSAFLAQRQEIERVLCGMAGGPEAEAIDLRKLAEGAVYATSTRLAACLLESEAGRRDSAVLQVLAGMVDVNDDPRLPEPEAPSIASIRRLASELLRGLGGS